MNNLIRAELLKLRTTRTFSWSVIAALAFVPVSIALAIAKVGTPSGTSLDSAHRLVLSHRLDRARRLRRARRLEWSRPLYWPHRVNRARRTVSVQRLP